jgi:hypothetical protein
VLIVRAYCGCPCLFRKYRYLLSVYSVSLPLPQNFLATQAILAKSPENDTILSYPAFFLSAGAA